tara:strand:+ start:536 stop:1006 length:471 start_codon:yes stop_codon:yes gene_type:complete
MRHPPIPEGKLGMVFVRNTAIGRETSQLTNLVVRGNGDWDGRMITQDGTEQINAGFFRQTLHSGSWRPEDWIWGEGSPCYHPPDVRFDRETNTWVKCEPKSDENALPSESSLPKIKGREGLPTWTRRCIQMNDQLDNENGRRFINNVWRKRKTKAA